ncbi:VCBS domain-containing protein [Paraburkholderia sp. FT54]|uniref:VCBS domain-containing protein n=1 Tax=Paraburkholderia sp. FT54 TaxID=3074437 RepID=UPI002877542E|nr:VCBS domain-containing protein [Paraburkholderia sp. FT54]WNC94589.1 VCBS domain-containing protein [Paraburkholderia sp. FT54]
MTSMLWACGGSTNSTPAQSGPNPASGTTPSSASAQPTLLVSRAIYDAAFTVTGTLPFNATPETTNAAPVTAVSPGTYPNVFTTEGTTADANFGVTSDAVIDQWATGATSPTQYLDVTAAAKQNGFDFTTSFASKSELALNLSQDGSAITFNGYNAAIDSIDRSNSNTPGVIDPTNTDIATPTYRTVAQLNLATKALTFTNTNAYSGNNGRASVLAGGQYYIVGNAGNSGSSPNPTYGQLDMLTINTGVQTIAAGSSCAFSQPVGAFFSGNSSTYTAPTSCGLGTITDALSSTTFAKKTNAGGNQFGFSLTSLGLAYDKTGKDGNFRGLFLASDGTLYVSKGSGSNGLNTVFQVGATGALANGAQFSSLQNVNITPLFSAPTTAWSGAPAASNEPASNAALTSALTTAGVTSWPLSWNTGYPFGMWMPKTNTNLMFVADEGDGDPGDMAIGSGGLWVYQKSGSTWTAIAHLTQGLNLGQAYTVTDTSGTYGTVSAKYTTSADGLRNVTGVINSDGSYTLYAVTSTANNSLGTTFDAGADSNQLVKITLSVSGSTVTTSSGFTVMQTAPYGQVLRGVAMSSL